MRSKVLSMLNDVILALITIVIALSIGAVLIIISGNDPIQAYRLLWTGAFGSPHRISETIVKAVPLLIMALGISIAFRNGLWNIGGNGQFTLGAILSLSVGIYLELPAWLMLPVSMFAAFVGGAAWGGLAGWLKAKFNANEVITTLMLNYIATYLLAYLVYGPMMDPAGFRFPQTPLVPEAYRLSLFSAAMRIHTGIFLAAALVIVMIFFWRSTLGYKIELMGQGEQVARYAGVDAKRTMTITMALSGGLVGIAGWNEVYGVHYRLLTEIAGGYGNIAIVIALLGGLNPFGIAISSYFFSVLIVGGNTMQRRTEVPYSIVDVIQSLVIILVISRAALNVKRRRSE